MAAVQAALRSGEPPSAGRPARPLPYYISPSGMASHAAFACEGSQAHDAAQRDLERRQGRGANYTSAGSGGAKRTDEPADLAIKCCCFGCALAYAACWEGCGGNPAADPAVRAAMAALPAPSASLILLGRPLHGPACCWCTSDTHAFWNEELFARAVSGGGLPPAHALQLIDGLEERLAAARGDLPQLARALASGPDAEAAAAWAAALGADIAMEQLPGGRWVVRVAVHPPARTPKQQQQPPLQQAMASTPRVV